MTTRPSDLQKTRVEHQWKSATLMSSWSPMSIHLQGLVLAVVIGWTFLMTFIFLPPQVLLLLLNQSLWRLILHLLFLFQQELLLLQNLLLLLLFLFHQMLNVWIGDDHIDHCQGLLLKQFPATKGLQNRMLFGTHDACNVGAPDGEFLQILNMSGTHWLCASTVGCDPGIINLFDSLYTGSTTPQLLNELARMIHTDSPEMIINWQQCSKQVGGNDCGLFALAFATALCHGLNPSSFFFSQGFMHAHLQKCMTEGKMTMFPGRSTSRPRCKKSIRVPLFCHCRMPNDTRLKMIACAICSEWFHDACEKVPESAWSDRKASFTCKNCLKWNFAVDRLYSDAILHASYVNCSAYLYLKTVLFFPHNVTLFFTGDNLYIC